MSRNRSASMRTLGLAALVMAVLATAAIACAARPDPSSPAQGDSSEVTMRRSRLALTPQPTPGLRYRLSEGREQAGPAEVLTPATAEPLAAADTQKLLDRLPPLTGEAGDVMELNLPKDTLPAPRPGKTIKEPFPPVPAPISAPQVTTGPLEVLRYAPEGDVPVAPNLSITFNQPMVALTSIGDLAKQNVPVKLSPQPDGQWRWVGTKTLFFEPAAKTGFAAGRLPAATKYTVEIPAGTTSATGGKLAKAVSFSFTTPAPAIEVAYPKDGPTRRDTPFFVSFNQRIDPAAVLKTIVVRAGGRTFPLQLLPADDLPADEALRSLAANAQSGRWLAFKTTEPLPADAAVEVVVGPGVPSAEGPLTSPKAEAFSFRTYGPLTVVRSQCGWGGECTPFLPWQIEFSNPLDRNSITEASVKIEPALPNLTVEVFGNTMQIRGASQGRTTYRVTLDAGIGDIFGQVLGSPVTVTFAVGSAQPSMGMQGGNFVVLDPLGKPALSVYTINYNRLAVRAYAVKPEDWPAFKTYMQERYRTDNPPAVPGQLVYQKAVPIESVADKLVETAVDLDAAFKQAQGHLVVLIKPERTGLSALLPGRSRPEENVVWVQKTQIGLDAFVDAGQALAWTTSLKDGSPLANVELSLWPGSATARSNDAGMATLALPAGAPAQLLLAKANGETAMLPSDAYFWGGGGWQQRPLVDQLRWYVFDDRKMYRPGEEVHIKGWLRRWGAGPRGDISMLQGAEAVTYRLQDSRGNEIVTGRAGVNASGGFDFVLKLSDTMNLGPAYLQFDAVASGNYDNRSYGHQIDVQEFRRPEFEVKLNPGEGPYFVADSATVEASAAYYAGGPLPNAPVNWTVTSSSGSYSPPGWDDFTFGRWVPWWHLWWSGPEKPQIETGKTFTGTTDAGGLHVLRIDFDSVVPAEPSSLRVEASVEDVNRQAWTASANLLVHPASLYVGLRTERLFVEKDQPLPVDIIVTDLDGQPVAGAEVKLTAARLQWKWNGSSYEETGVDPQPCTVKSETKPVRCTFETPQGGTYRITAVVTDDKGRPNQTELTRWVSGGDVVPSRDVQQEEVTLVPDKKTYRAGETAEILVQAPFYPAEGLLTLRRSGLVKSERFTLDGPSTTLRVPIEEGYVPNVFVQVDLVGASARAGDAAVDTQGQPQTNLPKRPAYARGELDLSVPPLARTLTVEAKPQADKLEPGGTTQLDLIVRDAAGKPVPNAELAVAVVDEAILALTGYDLPDPLTSFYDERSTEMMDSHNRGYIVLANPMALDTGAQAANDAATGAGAPVMAAVPAPAAAEAPRAMATQTVEKAVMQEGGQANTPIAVRTDFNPLANWSPAVPTDGQGRATITIKVPDNLTRYRVMVVAVAGAKQFGKGASAVTARLPLMVRPSAPRFLNFGDKFELPVVVQNQTDAPMTVDVALQTANLELTEGTGRRVTVPANDRVEVRFPATTVASGTARFQVAAASGKWADAANISLPVYTPATTEAFAVYGVVDEGSVAQPVIAPTGVYTQFGGLEIQTSSTALQALTDAFLYLVAYPFECSEQLASRILSVAALRDVLTAFQAEGLPAAPEIEASMKRDIERLDGMQNDDGGFPVWKRGDESWPYYSIHATHALQRAKMKGYAVPGEMLDSARSYLVDIESKYPYWYGPSVRNTLSAYALYVRNLMGDKDAAKARKLIAESGLDTGSPTALTPEAVGWLLSVLTDDPGSKEQVAQIRRYLDNRVTETAGAAHFVSSYSDQDYVVLGSNRRGDGVILDALIGDQAAERLDPQAGRGVAGRAERRALVEHAGERLHPARARPLLQYLRGYDARLRGPCMAGRPVPGRIDVPRPHDRLQADHGAYGVPGAGGPDDRERDPRQGWAGPAVLPAGAALRAEGSESARLRRRFHRRAQV